MSNKQHGGTYPSSTYVHDTLLPLPGRPFHQPTISSSCIVEPIHLSACSSFSSDALRPSPSLHLIIGLPEQADRLIITQSDFACHFFRRLIPALYFRFFRRLIPALYGGESSGRTGSASRKTQNDRSQ